jgi:hypothetical protein
VDRRLYANFYQFLGDRLGIPGSKIQPLQPLGHEAEQGLHGIGVFPRQRSGRHVGQFVQVADGVDLVDDVEQRKADRALAFGSHSSAARESSGFWHGIPLGS